MQNIIRVQRVANPSSKRRKATKTSASRRKVSARRRRRSNPLRVLTLGASNPRRKKVAARKTTRRRRRRSVLASTTRRRRTIRRRRANPVARTRRAANPARRRNATRITIRRTRRNSARRRNPQLFGTNVSTGKMVEAVLGGLVGVTAAKLIPANLPGNFTGTPVMRILSSVASAFAAGWVGDKVSRPFGDAVLFGGLMQAGSLALNSFIPSIGTQIGLSGVRGGLGELMAGAFPVPQNPLNPNQANYPLYGRPIMAAADATYGTGAPVAMNGIARAFGRAF
jgi:hypothetical protein